MRKGNRRLDLRTRTRVSEPGPDGSLPGRHGERGCAAGLGFCAGRPSAFRTGTLDDLCAIRANLAEAGVEASFIYYGNAWSLYFSDCESNKVECLVDTPFHVAQPFGHEFDLDKSAEEILESTRQLIASKPEFQPMKERQAEFAKRLEQS